MPIVMYGIKNCDTIKKAKKWLTDNGIEFTFHDYRQDGLNEALLSALEGRLGWQAMINKRGTTWRKLDDEVKSSIDREKAISIMLENPAIIKRPILDTGKTLELGFSADQYQQLLST
ncbi:MULTISPECIES: ArsC family reductase [Cycloclasticus]|jgi:Spx/MgsR family transcriptional regulator|uniref:Arsenate reductase n=1 Tax=Cycloclasticus pugetii TaxID=34068 RepID=A0AB33Z312_9GAMM|nr:MULTISPECIES: ArsC family reductase [Cycloclasticus]ATI03016.1 ArsC family reductase [Cycloclasticus sp. PY97N]EPD13769.1 Arsenate reductase [Cycloclasticus pugetii]MDF1829371.1 ArsC family reductase [Cycloclasticus pugetii]|tara:strand:+ start:3500 stop:3850 length:351 start_codon:yes stop_codon:yes gene_type:complete